MLYTETDVMDYIEQEDVKFIRLVFTDMFGLQKNISIMPKELPKAFRSGISFDASAIRGFAAEDKSDLLLFPDPATLARTALASGPRESGAAFLRYPLSGRNAVRKGLQIYFEAGRPKSKGKEHLVQVRRGI